jgi:bacterioferritin-associated ferredoxin
MLVCSCRAVNDRAVRAAIDEGAHTVEEITDRCDAGAECFGCWPELERLLDEHTGAPHRVAAA